MGNSHRGEKNTIYIIIFIYIYIYMVKVLSLIVYIYKPEPQKRSSSACLAKWVVNRVLYSQPTLGHWNKWNKLKCTGKDLNKYIYIYKIYIPKPDPSKQIFAICLLGGTSTSNSPLSKTMHRSITLHSFSFYPLSFPSAVATTASSWTEGVTTFLKTVVKQFPGASTQLKNISLYIFTYIYFRKIHIYIYIYIQIYIHICEDLGSCLKCA